MTSHGRSLKRIACLTWLLLSTACLAEPPDPTTHKEPQGKTSPTTETREPKARDGKGEPEVVKLAADAPKPLSPKESAARMKLPSGFRIELVASEPLHRLPHVRQRGI